MKRSTIALEDATNFDEIEYEPPEFDSEKNYYSMFWSSMLNNEKIMNEIQDVASDNLRTLNQIYNLEDFYENNLLPKMFAFPHQYVTRMIANRNCNKESANAGKESAHKENIRAVASGVTMAQKASHNPTSKARVLSTDKSKTSKQPVKAQVPAKQ